MLYRNQLSDLHCKSDDSFLYQTEHLIEMRLKRALNILWGFAKLVSIVVLAGFWCLWHCWIPDTFIFFVWHDWYFRCLPGHDSRNFKAYILPFYRWIIKGVKRTHKHTHFFENESTAGIFHLIDFTKKVLNLAKTST